MKKSIESIYQDLAQSDARNRINMQREFEEISGLKIDDEVFKAIYLNARYIPEFNTFPKLDLKELYVESRGQITLAATNLYKHFSRKQYPENADTEPSRIANEVLDKGYCVIENFLSNNEISAVKDELCDFEYYESMLSREHTFKLQQLRDTEGSTDYSSSSRHHSTLTGSTIEAESQLGRLFIKPFMADIASHYFKSQSYLTGAVSFHTREKDPKLFTDDDIHGLAQNWHLDYGNLRFLKFFIYLTDVELENGPHSFISESHEEKFVYPSSIEDLHSAGLTKYKNGLFSGLIKDEWVNRNFDSDRVKEFCYPKGTLLVVNTSGLHKGGYCQSGSREVLSLIYAISNGGALLPVTQPSLNFSPEAPSGTHLGPVLATFFQEQQDVVDNFSRKVSYMTRVKNKIGRMTSRESV